MVEASAASASDEAAVEEEAVEEEFDLSDIMSEEVEAGSSSKEQKMREVEEQLKVSIPLGSLLWEVKTLLQPECALVLLFLLKLKACSVLICRPKRRPALRRRRRPRRRSQKRARSQRARRPRQSSRLSLSCQCH